MEMRVVSKEEKDCDTDLRVSNESNLHIKDTNADRRNYDYEDINPPEESSAFSNHKEKHYYEMMYKENNVNDSKINSPQRSKVMSQNDSLPISITQTEKGTVIKNENPRSRNMRYKVNAIKIENEKGSLRVHDSEGKFSKKSLPLSKVSSYSNSKTAQTTELAAGRSIKQDDSEDLTMPFATMADLKMPNFEIKIDIYSKAPFIHSPPPQRSPSPPESPQTKKRRLEENARAIEKHGRLHPSNRHLNQGPVVNPPLISPATMVGFSPGGQRYEFDLNTERPTRFNSEYDRRMHDNAMRMNVRKMLNELSEGCYLPPSLDANIERRYYEEVRMLKEEALKYFEQCTVYSNDDEWEDMTESEERQRLALLNAEEKLLEIVGHAELKLADFPEQMSIMLKSALQLNLSAVMFKKNPIIFQVLCNLSKSRNHTIEYPAKNLLCKSKALFDIPSGLNFKEHYLVELENFKKKTEHMSPFQLMMITDEPVGGSDSSDIGDGGNTALNFVCENLQLTAAEIRNSTISSTEDNEPVWIPVEDANSTTDTCESDSRGKTVTVVHDDVPWRSRQEWEIVEVEDGNYVNLDDNEIEEIMDQLLAAEEESSAAVLLERIREE